MKHLKHIGFSYLDSKISELSRDVIFEEDLAFKRALSSEEPSPLPSFERNTYFESQRENIEEIEDEIQNLNLGETQNSKKKTFLGN